MKKKLFALVMVLGFIWGTVAFAWQDPCLVMENEYVCEGYTLTSWEESLSYFSPAPRCAGTVLLINSNGTWASLDYRSSGDKLLIAGIPCWLGDDGNLVCKIITQPEESESFIFEERE